MKVRKEWTIFVLFVLLNTVILFSTIFFQEITVNNFVDKEHLLGFLALISMSFYFIILKLIEGDIFSLQSLFVIFMYLFNLGIPIARLLWGINDSAELFLQRRIYPMGYDTYIHYITYTLILILFLEIGILYYYVKIDSDEKIYIEKLADFHEYQNKLNRCRDLGRFLLVIGTIPYFYSEVTFLKNAIVFGYQNLENTYSLAGTGLGFLSQLFLLGYIMVIFSSKENKVKFDFLFWIMSVYQLVRMLISGDRSTGVMLLFVFIFIRHKFVAQIKGKKTILFAVLLYFGMLFIKYIELTRSVQSSNPSEILGELFQNNMLVETVIEYGGNVWCGLMVYYAVPQTGWYRCGLTYLAALVGKPLQIFGITNRVWQFSDFSYFLQDPSRGALINSLTSAMGGSFSGEWYFNFGWIGIPLISIFGYYLAKISDLAEGKILNPVITCYWLYMFTLIIWWVRQYFTSVLWYGIFCASILLFLSNIIHKNEKNI